MSRRAGKRSVAASRAQEEMEPSPNPGSRRNNPTFTLAEIIAVQVQAGHPNISLSTLHSYLDHELIAYKQISHHNQLRNSPETLESRREWAWWFLNNQHCELIYIDEFGFNLSTQRNFGRAPSGHPAVQATPANRGANLSVMAAVQKSVGIVAHAVRAGPFDAESFLEFARQLIVHYQMHPVPNVCLVMDNCRIHRADELRDVVEVAGFLLEFLPPDSPMMNPIEEVIGNVKREIRRLLSTTLLARVLEIQALRWGEKAPAPRTLLWTALAQAIGFITIAQVDAHFVHSYSFLPQALNREQL
jgi:hypothetical protein